MTFQQLIETCADEYGKDSGEWIARYKRFLNRGQLEIANAKDWSWLFDVANTFSTTNSEKDYTTTETDIKKLLNVRVTTDGYRQRLTPYSYDQFITRHPAIDETAPDQQGPVFEYTTIGRTTTNQLKIVLWPVPDTAYTIEYDYLKSPASMTDDADAPVFPTAYHHLLIDYVLWKSYQHDRDLQTALIYQQNFEKGLRQMMGEYMVPDTAELHYINYDGQEVE